MENEKIVNLGYKYRLYPNKDQIKILNHQMYIYNQAYNICLNLWQKENSKNKDLPKELQKKLLVRKPLPLGRGGFTTNTLLPN